PERYIEIPPQVVVSELTGQRKIGLAWSAAASHVNEPNRAIPLADLLALTEGIDAQFYSLQMPLSHDERDLLKQHNVIDLEPELPGYARTAALVDQLDVVISVDTAIAHLAAALGRKSWILLCNNDYWRWHKSGETSEWYPTAKIFRQENTGDWREPVKQIKNRLNVIH